MARRITTNRIFSASATEVVANATVDRTTGQIVSETVLPFNLTIDPEELVMAVDAPDAGHGGRWLWSWNAGAVPYARVKIDQVEQNPIAIYLDSRYTIYNFAAHEIVSPMTQTHKLYLKWIEGAGTANLVPWSVSTLNVENISFPGVRNGTATEVQRLIINVPETITLPTLVAPTVSYDVTFANAGSYTFGGSAHGQNPDLGPFYRGGTYTFNVNASGHPFYLTTDDGTNFESESYVGEYTSGVTGSRTDVGTVTFVVPQNAPDTLYYQCGVHSPMRGEIQIKDLAVEYNESGNLKLFFQHDQDDHAVEVDLRPKPRITDQTTLVFDAARETFVPQDLGIYLDRTVQFQTKIEDLVDEKIVSERSVTTNTINSTVLYNINLAQQGNLQVTTGTARWYAPFDLVITDIRPRLGTAADGNVTGLVRVNGTNSKTFTITSGQTSVNVTSPTINVSEGSYLTLDVTAVGSEAAPGVDLFVQFTYRRD